MIVPLEIVRKSSENNEKFMFINMTNDSKKFKKHSTNIEEVQLKCDNAFNIILSIYDIYKFAKYMLLLIVIIDVLFLCLRTNIVT